MNLLELHDEQSATITQLEVRDDEHERLRARGILIGATIRKTYDEHATQPVVISTHSHNVFAISRSLAQKIIITPLAPSSS